MATSATLAVDRSVTGGGARALPAWIYQHPEMTRLELERVLRPSWQIACHVSQLPRPGDFVTLELGSDSIVVLRDREQRVRAFHNVCRHRGARILDGDGHCPGTVVCPYHGWSYGYDGSLLGVPGRDSFPGLDRSSHGLVPVRVEVLLGFVFVVLGGDPPPLRERWAPFLEELAPYRLEEMVPLVPLAFGRILLAPFGMRLSDEGIRVSRATGGHTRFVLADDRQPGTIAPEGLGHAIEQPGGCGIEARVDCLPIAHQRCLLIAIERRHQRATGLVGMVGDAPDQRHRFKRCSNQQLLARGDIEPGADDKLGITVEEVLMSHGAQK